MRDACRLKGTHRATASQPIGINSPSEIFCRHIDVNGELLISSEYHWPHLPNGQITFPPVSLKLPYRSKALLELLLAALNRQRILLHIPFAMAEMQAGLLELLPNPPLTRDQVRLLKTDKVLSGREPTLGDLGVQASPLDETSRRR